MCKTERKGNWQEQGVKWDWAKVSSAINFKTSIQNSTELIKTLFVKIMLFFSFKAMNVTTNATSAPSKPPTAAQSGSQVSTSLSSVLFITASLFIQESNKRQNVYNCDDMSCSSRSLQRKRPSSWKSVWVASLKQMSDAVAAALYMAQTCWRRAL